jgi:hypothetical protein
MKSAIVGICVAAALIAVSAEPASASVVDVTLTVGGSEQTEDFTSISPEYEFSFTASSSDYLDAALGGASGDQWSINIQNSSADYNHTYYYYDSPQSPNFYLFDAGGAGIYAYDVYVTLLSGEDPYGGFEISNTPMTLLDPTPTPIPATLPLLATGLGALALLAWHRKRKAQPVVA